MPKVQIGISVDPQMNDNIQRLAEAHRMTRPQFMVHLAQEAINADAHGRPLFQIQQAPPTPSVDAGLLVTLVAELGKLEKRLASVLRAHDQRDARLMQYAQVNSEAIAAAEQLLYERIRNWLNATFGPYSKRLDELTNTVVESSAAGQAKVAEHYRAIPKLLTTHPDFQKVTEELLRQRTLIAKGRPPNQIHVFENIKLGRGNLAWMASTFCLSVIFLVILSHIIPSWVLAQPIAAFMLLGDGYNEFCSSYRLGYR